MKQNKKEVSETPFEDMKKILDRQKKAIREIDSLMNYFYNAEEQDKGLILSQIKQLRDYMNDRNKDLLGILEDTVLMKPLPREKKKKSILKVRTKNRSIFERKRIMKRVLEDEKLTGLEKTTLRRVRSKKGIPLGIKDMKPNKYINIANTLFSENSRKLMENDIFISMGKDLIRTKLQITPISYVSVMFLSTVISFLVSILIFMFFLFFSMQNFPLIEPTTGSIWVRFLNIFWILFAVPIFTFVFMYFYPSMEKKSAESKINQELPFATMHMSTISGSMIEPTKIFSIIVKTKEYKHIEIEFKKLLNMVNVYGYDFVTALRNSGTNCPSKKLADLFNSLATTIVSGGDLSDFFIKRSQTLLYDYKLEREKYIKFSETFMDLYISIVIAAPMILMLLLLMMRLGGLGVPMSSGMITLIMIISVSSINAVFLGFLRIKQPAEY